MPQQGGDDPPGREKENPQTVDTARGRVLMRDAGADRPVVAMRPGNAGGAKGAGHPGVLSGQPQLREEPVSKPRPKPFAISKEVVWKAYLKGVRLL
jgi:hypothetical protein